MQPDQRSRDSGTLHDRFLIYPRKEGMLTLLEEEATASFETAICYDQTLCLPLPAPLRHVLLGG